MTSHNSNSESLSTPSSWQPLTREERKSCWKARDAFYDCLDRAKILDGNSDEAKQTCSQLIRDFENACPSSWVDYFKTRRLLEARQKALLTNEAPSSLFK